MALERLLRGETRGAGRSYRDRGCTAGGASRRIAHRLPEILTGLGNELKYRRLSTGRGVRVVRVSTLGTPAPLTRVVAGAPLRPRLGLVQPSPKLLEVEIRVGRLRIILGRELEDQRRARRLANRQLRGASLPADRDLR